MATTPFHRCHDQPAEGVKRTASAVGHTETEQVRVLVVDDEPQICALIGEELSEHGFVCLEAQEADRARAVIDSQPPDVMIADIRMPRISGLELLAYAKKHAPRCRVVLITGNYSRQYVAQALLLGAYDYIEKPLNTCELVEVVAKAVNGGANTPVLVDRAATAMEMNSQVRRASLDSVTALARAVEAKDPYTRRHSEHVARYAVHLAQEMGLPASTVESIETAALLHDIGKIGVPDHILAKPGPLTDEEFQHIRRHPALGANILASITLFGDEAKLVRYHHETWDGEGYPDGLTGEESPVGSRIIQVADSMDAMLMHRTYKKGYSVEKMLGELVRCSGTQFAPEVTVAAVQWCRTCPEKLILAGEPAAAAV